MTAFGTPQTFNPNDEVDTEIDRAKRAVQDARKKLQRSLDTLDGMTKDNDGTPPFWHGFFNNGHLAQEACQLEAALAQLRGLIEARKAYNQEWAVLVKDTK